VCGKEAMATSRKGEGCDGDAVGVVGVVGDGVMCM
jgi:hypothetical protein